MKTHNPENERTKRDYFGYLKNARGLNETSIDAAAKAIARFEGSTRYKSFKAFHHEQANAFKRQLAAQVSERSGGRSQIAALLEHRYGLVSCTLSRRVCLRIMPRP
jgi:hypothetical protein